MSHEPHLTESHSSYGVQFHEFDFSSDLGSTKVDSTGTQANVFYMSWQE